MKNIFIGIDGGGTKTRALAEDGKGNFIGSGFGGSSNIRLSVDNSWISIYEAINHALEETNISLDNKQYNFHVGMGLAGVSITEAKNKFLNTENPFTTLVLESDAHIACIGANNGKNGAIISIGTGVIGYMIENNISCRIGGWGFPHADTGGGAWFGMEATRLTLSWIDGCIESSNILENIFSHFNNDLPKLVRWANSANSSEFASLAPYVVSGLKNNDKYSFELFKKAGLEIDLLIKALINKKQNKTVLPFRLTGGLAPFISKFLKSENTEVNQNKDAAIKGAILLIRKSVNI